jgi:hypothetical protein
VTPDDRVWIRAPSFASCWDEQVGAFHTGLAAIERTIDRIRLTRLVLGRAALPMATLVKTLDALHFASALPWRERRAAELLFAP